MSQPGPAIDGVLNNESGTPIENDNGRGLSVWGITWATATEMEPTWTEDTLRNLTRQQAATFYQIHFWIPSNIGMIDDQELSNKTFDLSVNMGQRTAIKLLQQAAGAHPVDGVIGPATAKTVNAMNPQSALAALRIVAASHYESLVTANPALAVDLNGWLARLDRA